jgi:hypothetical protein
MKLNSDDRHNTDYFANKFVSKLEEAMRELPEPLEWQSFYINDFKKYLNTTEQRPCKPHNRKCFKHPKCFNKH